jgi:hypothetical protein
VAGVPCSSWGARLLLLLLLLLLLGDTAYTACSLNCIVSVGCCTALWFYCRACYAQA